MAVFFMHSTASRASQTKTIQKWSLASAALRDAYTDFLLSRQAMSCTPITMVFYRFTAGKFLKWIDARASQTRDKSPRATSDNTWSSSQRLGFARYGGALYPNG